MSRPEHTAPPEVFYNEEEAKKYSTNSRIIEIQSKMSERALELLNLSNNSPKLILDIGCGSGLSGEIITENGHKWIGIDISQSMINVAVKKQVENDICLADMGDGLFFRPGTFDAAISISALQWLCNADKSYHEPRKRLNKFFQTLHNCLAK
jgi:18S rRNA (guanine1575-N7)-methyltransferase